jgi:hypothetical protein
MNEWLVVLSLHRSRCTKAFLTGPLFALKLDSSSGVFVLSCLNGNFAGTLSVCDFFFTGPATETGTGVDDAAAGSPQHTL